MIIKKEKFVDELKSYKRSHDLRICNREKGGARILSIDVTTEKRFEADIEEFFLSPAGGYTHNNDVYDPQLVFIKIRC